MWNAINRDLNRAARIVSFFTEEIPTIKRKFLKLDHPPRFADSVSKQLNEKCNVHTEDDYIIKPYFFDILKPLVLAGFRIVLEMNHFQNVSLKDFMNLPTTHTKLE